MERAFYEVIGGVDNRILRGGVNGVEEGIAEEMISWEEIRSVVREMKDMGRLWERMMSNEIWKYGGEELEEWVWKFCNKVWRGEGWPERWKEGIIISIVKKGKREKMKEYRGVTLMSLVYKIYATVLAERISEEVEEKGILADNQTSFRKGNNGQYLRLKLSNK